MERQTKWKRSLSLLLALSMMFSLFSMNAFAAEPDDADYVPEETNAAVTEEVSTETEESEQETPDVPEETEVPETPEQREESKEIGSETPEQTVDPDETAPEEPVQTDESDETALENAEPKGPAYLAASKPSLGDGTIGGSITKPGSGIGDGNIGTIKPIDPGDGPIIIRPISCKHPNQTYTINANGTHTSYCPDCEKTVEKDQPHTMTYTMNADGTHTGVCKSCADEETEEHTMEWVVTKEATFEEPGEKVLTCSVCGFMGETEEIAKLTPVAEVNGQQYASLQAALDAVKSQYGDKENSQTDWTVKLVADTTECVTMSVVPTSAKDITLTIDLNGKTITGTGNGAVISVGKLTSYDAAVQFIIADSVGTGTVTGGTGSKSSYGSATYGGAIYVSSSNSNTKLIINGGNFTGNTATYGGVISSNYLNDVPVIINGGTFTGNTVTENGGAIYARTVTVNGGIFTGNTAGKGGAIYVVGSGWTANLNLNRAKVYGNTAAAFGDDIVFGLTGNFGRATTLSLMNASAMGIDDINAWLVDGYNLNEETARVSDDNRVEFVEKWPNTEKTGKAMIALKAGLDHTHTAGEPAEENRVDATYEAAGSYELVTKCEICGKELSRETVKIDQLVSAPVEPVTPTAPAETPADNNNNGTPAAPVAPTTPDDPEDDDGEIDEQDVPTAAPEAAPAETAPEAAEPAAEEEPVTIDEEDTPLATIGESGTKGWSLLNLVLALVTVLMSLMMLASYFKAKSNMNLVSVIPAVFAVVTFMVTSNLSGSMTFADSWTPAMLLFAALNAGVVAFAMKKRKENV